MDNKPEVLTRNYRYVITFVIYFCYFVYAMNLYITGPSLLDLKRIYKTSFSDISNINTVRSFAYTFGSLNGFLFQYINRQIGFSFFLIIIAISMGLTPHLPSMNMLFINFAINGYASGGIESVSDVWILEMWQQECGPFVQALHFTFGVGSILTPLIVEPFLSENTSEDIKFRNSNTTETSVINIINGRETTVEYFPELIPKQSLTNGEVINSRIYIPYSCGAIAIAFSALIIGGLFFYKKYIPPQSRKRETVLKPELKLFERINISFRTQLMPTKPILIMIVLSGYLISLFLGIEWSQFNYFPSFAHFSHLQITEKRAAVISTGLAIAFTIGRAIAIPLSHFLRPKTMIFGSLCLLMIANFLFLFFANDSEFFMWFANIVFGFGLSSIYASIYAMVEEQTVVNNMIGGLFIFMSGLTSTVYPFIIGNYIESDPMVLIYVNILSTVLAFLFLISIHIIISKYISKSNFDTLVNN